MDSSGPSGMDVGGSGGPSGEVLKGIIRRQWWLVGAALVASATIGFAVSKQFAETEYTAHMTLSAQTLPGAGQDVYTPPSPAAAASLLQSSQFISSVATTHGFESPMELMENLKISPNQNAGNITVSMTLASSERAIAVLTGMQKDFENNLLKAREAILETQFGYLKTTQNTTLNELNTARSALARIQDEEIINNRDSLKNAELDTLVKHQLDIQKQTELHQRQILNIRRQQRYAKAEAEEVFDEAARGILTARRRQVESFAKGMTSASKRAAVRESLLKEIDVLEAELNRMLISDDVTTTSDQNPSVGDVASDQVGAEFAAESDPAGVSDTNTSIVASENRDVKIVPVEGGVSDESKAGEPGKENESLSLDEQLLAWRDKVEAVGADLGPLDPVIVEGVVSAVDRIEEFDRRIRVSTDDITEIESIQEELQLSAVKIEQEINRKARDTDPVNSEAFLEAKSVLADVEARYSRLAALIDQVQQVKNCPLTEYVVSSDPAIVSAKDIKSNRNKLFAFAALGSMFVLCIPSALVELLRLRPSPVNVISRRWNLPVLGIQAAALPSKMTRKERSAMARHELRLMALRIQQSLFDPKARVVLFCGLDHEESPMSLIRNLSKCFVQREESVLMIQTQPCQVEIARRLSDKTNAQKVGRPGVSEFLAGEIDDASKLIVNSGIAGIDFLPGGCTMIASEAMASSRLTRLIDQFRDRYSMILMCGPSTLHPADLQMLAARADGIVFTVNKKSLNSVYGEEVINDLIELGAPILGFAEQPAAGKKSFADKDHNDLSKSSPVITLPA
ncbi:MAG: hypothetical protein JNL58_28955 [Planctomyces sp.]|nr:hypothetical protein [Planctomyces sp.]